MNLYILFILILLHFVLAFLCLLHPKSHLRDRQEYRIPILLVPIFGPLMGLMIDALFLLDAPGTKPVELEPLRLDNDIYWTPFAKMPEDKDVIPLEEAILINNTKSRRKAVLSTFQDDSLKYLDILMVARSNDDVDTTHYATIQISKIQRQFQLKLQKYAAAYEKDPDNPVLLDEYIDLLGRYLQSPLVEKSILIHQRQVYQGLLNHKLTQAPNDRDTLIRKLRNSTDLREDYVSVLAIVDLLKQKWPAEEETWIEALRACVEWCDTERVGMVVQEMQTQKVNWTKRGREQVRPWVQR